MVSQSAIRLCEFDYDKLHILQSCLLIQRLTSSHSKIDEKHIETFFSTTL